MNYLTFKQINKIIAKLKDNEIVILPTDTIYGFSALAIDDNRYKINNLKKSNPNKPLIILISNLKQIPNLDTKKFQKVFKKHKGETILININEEKLGLRLIKRKDLCEIINKVGPIYSTSINISGQIFAKTKEEFLNFLDEDNIFYIGELANKSSRIYSMIEDKYLR